MSQFRTASGGRVDRARRLKFTFDGRSFEGAQGDTLASGQIQRADVAIVCVQALGNPDAVGKTFEIVAGEPGASVDWAAFFKPLKRDP